jgi:hypothetical protein
MLKSDHNDGHEMAPGGVTTEAGNRPSWATTTSQGNRKVLSVKAVISLLIDADAFYASGHALRTLKSTPPTPSNGLPVAPVAPQMTHRRVRDTWVSMSRVDSSKMRAGVGVVDSLGNARVERACGAGAGTACRPGGWD